MNEIQRIEVKEYQGELVVSSREVAGNFEKEHRNVLRDIENIVKEGCSNLSRPLFIESTYQHPQNKQWYKEYLLTRDGFSLLVMGFTGKKALDWKLKYIEAFNEMEQYIKEQQKVPTTYKEALQQLLAQVEENEKLQIENQQQTQAIEEMTPKADYFDALVDNNLLTNIRDTAKQLHVKQTAFTKWLIENNFCYRDVRGKIKPYADKMEYFELKEFTTDWGHSDTQTLITPKGKEAFRLLLSKGLRVKSKKKGLKKRAK